MLVIGKMYFKWGKCECFCYFERFYDDYYLYFCLWLWLFLCLFFFGDLLSLRFRIFLVLVMWMGWWFELFWIWCRKIIFCCEIWMMRFFSVFWFFLLRVLIFWRFIFISWMLLNLFSYGLNLMIWLRMENLNL